MAISCVNATVSGGFQRISNVLGEVGDDPNANVDFVPELLINPVPTAGVVRAWSPTPFPYILQVPIPWLLLPSKSRRFHH